MGARDKDERESWVAQRRRKNRQTTYGRTITSGKKRRYSAAMGDIQIREWNDMGKDDEPRENKKTKKVTWE